MMDHFSGARAYWLLGECSLRIIDCQSRIKNQFGTNVHGWILLTGSSGQCQAHRQNHHCLGGNYSSSSNNPDALTIQSKYTLMLHRAQYTLLR